MGGLVVLGIFMFLCFLECKICALGALMHDLNKYRCKVLCRGLFDDLRDPMKPALKWAWITCGINSHLISNLAFI